MENGKASSRGRKIGYNIEREPGVDSYLTKLRTDKGLSQEEVAKELGITRSSICRIERGERQHKALHGVLIRGLANAYGVPLNDIMEKLYFPQLMLPTFGELDQKNSDSASEATTE
jgi:transcriptional regulator with XRE-family HTH domain